MTGLDDRILDALNAGICPGEPLTSGVTSDTQHCVCWWDNMRPCCRCGHLGDIDAARAAVAAYPPAHDLP